MSAVEALRRAPLFEAFSDAGLATVAAMAQARTLRAGEPLFSADDVGASMFVVVSGSVRVLRRLPSGGDAELATLGPGAHLGDLGLLAHTVRLVSAVAATDCEVLELARREFFRVAREKPVTCLKLAAVVAAEVARWAAESKDALRGLAAPRA